MYVRFRDNAGLVSQSYPDTIMLDTQPPSIALTVSLVNGTEIKSSACPVSWTSSDTGSGIDRHEVRLDNGAWAAIGTTSTYTFTGLSDGGHELSIKAVDWSGNSRILQLSIVINTSPVGGPGYMEEALLGVAIGAVVVGLFAIRFMKRPKKPPTPERVRIQAEPKEILADGRSRSTITVELLDGQGKPIPALSDTEVAFNSTKGRFEKSTITIPKGKEAERAVLVSSRETGPVTVSVNAGGLRSVSITLDFVEKPRFCMHCGARMGLAVGCPKCGMVPPSGVDVKSCKNCGEVIPAVAKFCSACGAGQPEQTK